MDIISIEFEYRRKTYYALVRIKEKQPKEYHVTIMNGSLEQQLYGNHIYMQEEEGIVIDPLPEKDTGDLRLAVGQALCKHFNIPCHSLENNI
jgi:hypothetical protein